MTQALGRTLVKMPRACYWIRGTQMVLMRMYDPFQPVALSNNTIGPAALQWQLLAEEKPD